MQLVSFLLAPLLSSSVFHSFPTQHIFIYCPSSFLAAVSNLGYPSFPHFLCPTYFHHSLLKHSVDGS